MGAPRAIALCQCFNGALEFQGGDWKTAEAALRESIEISRSLGAASGEALSWQRLGALHTAQGRLDEALEALLTGAEVAERAVMRAHCLSRIYACLTRNRLLAGEIERAREFLHLGLAMGERHGNCATCDALLLPAAISVHLALGQVEEARGFSQTLTSAAERYGSQVWVAMASAARGEVALAEERWPEALELYRAAAERYTGVGYVYEEGRARLGQARALFGLGRAEEAEELMTRARQALEDLGASVELELRERQLT